MERRFIPVRLVVHTAPRFWWRGIFRSLAIVFSAAPMMASAQFSEIKMGEYLNYATAAANGGVYAGINGIGYSPNTVFGTPALYTAYTNIVVTNVVTVTNSITFTNSITNSIVLTNWVGLPVGQGFDTTKQIYGTVGGISHNASVVAGSVTGTTTNGVTKQVAAYWVNGVESVIPDPPDDPGAITVSATAVSGDGTTLLVQDGNVYSATAETFVYKIAGGTFTSLGFLGGTNHQTFATAINVNGTVVAGYSTLDNGNISGFIWTSNGVTVLAIPTNHPDTFYLEPVCMSDDATVVYGGLTEGGGWEGFRYSATTGYLDLPLSPSACTADGKEVVGIENMYFPAVWSVNAGGGYLDHLVSANIAPQAFGTLGEPYTANPVTISPDGTAITALGPDYYPVDQIWYGTWQITMPSPLKAAPIPMATETFTTDYQTTLTEPAGTLTQYAEFNTGASAVLVHGPHYASAFALHADGSFSYTPKPGYISQGTDPEDGTPEDTITYKLTSSNGTSTNATIRINVLPPMPPTVDFPTYTNVNVTSATLGGTVTDNGGATVTAVGVVFAPMSISSDPQLGDGVSSVAPAVVGGVFTVGVSNLLPDTTYAYVAYATNSVGIGYSAVDYFTTPETFQSWQVTWYGSASNSSAASGADPYHTGVRNIEVYAYLGPYQDPSTANPAQLPQVQMSGGNFYYDFFEPEGVTGVTYGAKACNGLGGSWWPVPDTGSGTEHIFSVSVGNNQQLFMRLTVTAQ
jgi:probable HAF family extracellular repeat protein